MPTADRDSSPEPSDEPDPPIEEEGDVEEEGEDEVEEEQEEVEEEEEEMEVEEEEEEMEVEEEGQEGGAEEEEEEEEEDVEEEEEEGDERAGAGDEEKDKDTSKKLESEGHVEDLKLVSPTPGRSESNPATPSKDATGGSFVARDSSVKVRIENNKKPPNISAADVKSADEEEHISSEEKACSGSLADEKEITVHSKKKTHADSEHVKNFYLHAHGSAQAHLSCGDSISSENTATLQVQNKELAENMSQGGSVIGTFDGILEKEVSQLHPETELKMLEDSSLSSIHTPQRRPRSSSPGATPENSSKRPAVICIFFARGWCIKGNSCRFLHQKEGSKEDLADPNKKEDVLDGTGCREEVKRSRISSSQERPDSSNAESSSKSQFQIQRDLVRAYGGDSHDPPRPPHIHDDHNMHAGEEFQNVDIPQVGTLIQDDNKMPFGVSPRFDYMDERRSAGEHFSSSRYLHEEQLQWEKPKREFLNDLPFSRDSSLTESSAVPEHRYYSGTSSTSSSLYFNNNPFSHDRRTEDFSFRNHESSFPLHDSHSSYCLHGSFNSTFNSSYQPALAPSFNSEHPDIHKMFYLGKYHSSRSASLPRSSSPYFSRPEVENGLLRNVPRDLQASVRQKTETLENSWEPSVPFRPSFHYVPPSLSSPGRQYDPLLDSIEPCDTGNTASQPSERTINVSVSDRSNKGDHLLYGSQLPEHNVERTPGSFPQTHEGILDKSKPADELSTQTLVATPGHTAADGGNYSVPKEEKHLPDHLVESANVNGAENVADSRHKGDKNRINKESKAMKIFRSALVDFVKDLVKPSWREGHLSKDAHKMVVKKAVEKVLGALQTHQIPNTTGSINQYLSASRPKLLKLVEGYLEKYTKS